MGYKAVYPEEVINGHRAFVARRRALRPGEEYRTPTDEEWAEFVGHFDTARSPSVTAAAPTTPPGSTSTAACAARCCARPRRPTPPDRDPRQPHRPHHRGRIQRWLGEAEGLKVSLAGAEAKLAQMDQIAARRSQAVDLGIPTFTDAASRTSTQPANKPLTWAKSSTRPNITRSFASSEKT